MSCRGVLDPPTVPCAFWNRAARMPNTPALGWFDRSTLVQVSWAELAAAVVEEIERLRAAKVGAGDRVATALPNSPRWIVRDLACHTIGAIHVTIDHRLPARAVDALLDRVNPADVVRVDQSDRSRRGDPFSAGAAGRTPLRRTAARHWAEQAGQVPADAPASLLFTSGSTSEPKGVVLSHRNLLVNALAKLAASPQTAADIRMTLLPFSHAFARTCELSTWLLRGGRLVLCADWPQLLTHARQIQPTIMNLVPYLAAQLAELLDAHPNALGGRMRMLNVGGAAVSDELFRQLERHGLAPVQGYGLTEASPCVCANRFGHQRPGVVGPPVPDTEVAISADGELLVRGPQVMLGYWKDEESTRRAIVDGWLRTGDLAERLPDGSYRILGRRGEQFTLSTGNQVHPGQIERQVVEDPWIAQAVVLGAGQPAITLWVWPQWERLPTALFSAGPVGPSTLDRQSFLEALRRRIASRCTDWPQYLVPHDIRLLPEPLAVESGLLTAKGTPRRERIADYLAGCTSR